MRLRQQSGELDATCNWEGPLFCYCKQQDLMGSAVLKGMAPDWGEEGGAGIASALDGKAAAGRAAVLHATGYWI